CQAWAWTFPAFGAFLSVVMPALVAGIHVLLEREAKTWMAGTSPAMTDVGKRLQNKTHRAERAQFLRLDQHAAPLDAEVVAHAPQHVAVLADIFAHALVAAEAVADEVRRHRDQVALNAKNPHVRDHPARARLRKLGVAIRIVDADHPLADALTIVRHQEQRI